MALIVKDLKIKANVMYALPDIEMANAFLIVIQMKHQVLRLTIATLANQISIVSIVMTLVLHSTALNVGKVHSKPQRGANHATIPVGCVEDWKFMIVWLALQVLKWQMADAKKFVEMEETLGRENAMMGIGKTVMGKNYNVNKFYSCSSDCLIEENYRCYGGSNFTKDVCETGPQVDGFVA